MSDRRSGQGKWEIDRKVPVIPAIIMSLQLCGFVWYAAKLDSRVENLESGRQSSIMIGERVTRVEGWRDGLTLQVNRIEAKLDRALENKSLK